MFDFDKIKFGVLFVLSLFKKISKIEQFEFLMWVIL